MSRGRILTGLVLITGCLLPPSAMSVVTLDELLDQVRGARVEAQLENALRENRFLSERDQQKRRLAEVQANLADERQRGERLQQAFDANRQTQSELDAQLQERSGDLLELFTSARQAAREVRASLQESLVSTQIPGRSGLLERLAGKGAVLEIADLENLWYLLQQEMTESGKVVTYRAPVIAADGSEAERRVTRAGVFNAVAEGKFLRFLPQTGRLEVLTRQPSSRDRALAAALQAADTGMLPMTLDPTRGSVLGLLVQVPDILERIQQGRLVGYLIIALAVLGTLIAAERWLSLTLVDRRIRRQLRSDIPSLKNPLGRVMALYQHNSRASMETLELLIDESTLKETPRLQRGLHALKILAMIAPLLGLLGTVVGLIETFQSVTLFGTGDPRMMAGGISQALVTTVLGLIAAIPLTLMHSMLLSKSRRLIDVIEQQSIGIIAHHTEEHERHAAAA